MATNNSLNNQDLSDFTVTRAQVGGTVSTSNLNTDNTNAASSSRDLIQVGGASGGDAYTELAVSGVRDFAIGIDNSDGDKLKFNHAAGAVNPSSGTTMLWLDPSPTVPGTNPDIFMPVRLVEQDFSVAGGAAFYSLFNTNSASATADAGFAVSTNTAAAGDPYWLVAIQGAVRNYAGGIDNSDSQSFKINTDTALFASPSSGTNLFKLTSAGNITMPLTSAFLANLSADALNATGDGTVFTIIFDNEVNDQNSNYNSATGVFTAPVTGVYLFCGNVTLLDVGVLHTGGQVNLATTARNFLVGDNNPGAVKNGGNALSYNFSVITPMTSGDTATVTITVSGSTKTVDIDGTAAGTPDTFFSAHLLC